MMNELEISELRDKIRSDGLKCGLCRVRKATDVHHDDEHHSNNQPRNLMPVCKLCHNGVHGITAEMSDLKLLVRVFYEAQDQRKGAASKVRAYHELGIAVPYMEKALEYATEYEAHLEKQLRAIMKVSPFYNEWLKHVKGIGPVLAASLMAELGSPQKFDTVSALWSYCGLSVRDGEAVRRKQGEKSSWNPALKVTAWKISTSFVKCRGSLGRELYDGYKAYYIERDGPDPKWKPHRRAMRRAAKDFLRCMYIAWREQLGLEVTDPKPGTWPMPSDWIEGRGETKEVVETIAEFVPAPMDIEAR